MDFEAVALANIGSPMEDKLTDLTTAPEVGQIVAFYSRGRMRTGVIKKVGRKNVQVLYTTDGAVRESGEIHFFHTTRVAAQVEKDVRSVEARNFAFYEREIGPNAEFHGPNSYRGEDAPASYHEIVAEGKDAYIQRRVDVALAEVEAKRQEAQERGPLGYVHFTTKSVAIDKLAVVA